MGCWRVGLRLLVALTCACGPAALPSTAREPGDGGTGDGGTGTESIRDGGGGGIDEGRDGGGAPVGRDPFAAHELAIVRAQLDAYPFYDLVARRPPSGAAAELNPYLRAACSQVLMSALSRRDAGEALMDADVEGRWLAEIAPDLESTVELDGPLWWLSPAVALDCLLASSAAVSAADADAAALRSSAGRIANTTHRLANAMAADSRFSRAGFTELQRRDRGNSAAEEVGLAASFLHAASELLTAEPGRTTFETERLTWRSRAAELVLYATEQGDGAPFEAAVNLVNNHGMRPHPIYTLSLLTSFGEMLAVRRQLHPAEGPSQNWAGLHDLIPEEARTNAIGDAVAEFVTTEPDDRAFSLRGGFERIAPDGSVISRTSYGELTYTMLNPSSGSQLLIPTTHVGAVTGFADSDGTVHGYHVDGNRIFKFLCPRDAPCEAAFSVSLARQWAWVSERGRYGDNDLPTANVDAMPQYVRGEALHSTVYRGDRRWRYDCDLAGGVCTATGTERLADFAGAASSPDAFLQAPPMADLDAASHYFDATLGLVRVYWYEGARVWHYRCSIDGRCQAIYDADLASLWNSIDGRERFGSHPLPTDAIDGMSQVMRDGIIHSYVYRGDRVWKYECSHVGMTTACAAVFTKTLTDQYRSIIHQERWAWDGDRATTASGVCDWGFDATAQDSAWAFLAKRDGRGISSARYGALQQAQRARAMTSRPLLPPGLVDGRWHPDAPFDGPLPVRSLRVLADGFIADGDVSHPTLDEQRNAHYWLSMLAGYNAAVAYLMGADGRLLEALAVGE